MIAASEASAPPQALSDDARRHLGRGFNWLGGASIVARIVDLGTVLAMLLLLTKQQLGVGSLVVSIGTVIEAFSGLGTSEAVIQAGRVSRAELGDVFWYVLGAALLTGAVTLAVAAPVGTAYGVTGMSLYLLVIAAKMPLVGAAVVPLALLNRELRFGRIALVNLVATLGAAATRLALAVAGTGTWAPIAGYTASGLFILLGAQLARPFWCRPRCRFGVIAPLARFGLRSTLGNAAEQMFKNVDYLLVGWFYGAAPLATYRLAFDVAMEPPLAVATIVNRTAFPLLAREAAGRRDLTAILAWSLGRIAALAAPLLVALGFAAGPLTSLLHDAAGHSYAGAAVPLAILAGAAFLRVLFQPLSTVLVGAGRPGAAAFLALATLLLLGAGVAAAGALLPVESGLVAVSAISLAIYPVLGLFALASLRRHERIAFAPLFRAVARPAAVSLGLACCLASVRVLSGPSAAPTALALVVAPTAGCYLLLRLLAASSTSS